jgi:hypothetical protein
MRQLPPTLPKLIAGDPELDCSVSVRIDFPDQQTALVLIYKNEVYILVDVFQQARVDALRTESDRQRFIFHPQRNSHAPSLSGAQYSDGAVSSSA